MEIYKYKDDRMINPCSLWVYVDFKNQHLESEKNRFYIIESEGITHTEPAAPYADIIKNLYRHEQIEFNALSSKWQEIILADYPELTGGDELDEFMKHYRVS